MFLKESYLEFLKFFLIHVVVIQTKYIVKMLWKMLKLNELEL